MIRGDVHFNSSLVDDKVLLKADGMPTYHLAVVVDDYLMNISHAFRGEEWLSSAPVHILLWKTLFGLNKMPKWAHFPLILGPEGKLSKREAAKYGFPVFAMNWKDPNTGELTEGFREKGFLPQAFVNLLALLGWNDGSEQEIFSIDELTEKFTMERVHSSGAKFDYEKAKWFNHEWIKRTTNAELVSSVDDQLKTAGIHVKDKAALEKIIGLVKERCHLLHDFVEQSSFFFVPPEDWDVAAVKPKWDTERNQFFDSLIGEWESVPVWESAFLEDSFKKLCALKNIKPGDLQLPLRIMLVGRKIGPPVFAIAEVLGKEETSMRIRRALYAFNA
jgi:glutamyl-tRNA synthetase